MTARVSAAFRQHLLSAASERNVYLLLHAWWRKVGAAQDEHLRMALADHDVVHGGELYVGRSFALQLPAEGVDEQNPHARITLDGVPPEVRTGMRGLQNEAKVTIVCVRRDAPDVVEFTPLEAGTLRVAHFALPTMTVEIYPFENLDADPSVGHRFTPASGFRSIRL